MPGLTVASENMVYVQGDFNAAGGFGEPNAATAVISDGVTLLSNNWNDMHHVGRRGPDHRSGLARLYEPARRRDGEELMKQEEARFALNWIEEALRSAGSNPYSIAASNCPAAGTAFRAIRRDPNGNAVMDNIRIQADVNPPNALLGGLVTPCGEAGEDITIAHDPAAQTITVIDNNLGGAPTPMTDGLITQLQFTHLDANRVVTANENAIAFVQVAVTAQGPNRDRQLGQPATVTLTSEVRIRTR